MKKHYQVENTKVETMAFVAHKIRAFCFKIS